MAEDDTMGYSMGGDDDTYGYNSVDGAASFNVPSLSSMAVTEGATHKNSSAVIDANVSDDYSKGDDGGNVDRSHSKVDADSLVYSTTDGLEGLDFPVHSAIFAATTMIAESVAEIDDIEEEPDDPEIERNEPEAQIDDLEAQADDLVEDPGYSVEGPNNLIEEPNNTEAGPDDVTAGQDDVERETEPIGISAAPVGLAVAPVEASHEMATPVVGVTAAAKTPRGSGRAPRHNLAKDDDTYGYVSGDSRAGLNNLPIHPAVLAGSRRAALEGEYNVVAGSRQTALELEDTEGTALFSVIAANDHDEVSTLGETIGGSTLGGSTTAGRRGLRTQSSINYDIEDPVEDYDNHVPVIFDGNYDGRLNFPVTWQSSPQKDHGQPIETAPTGETFLDESGEKGSTESGFNYPRLTYLAFCLMGPVLLGTIVALTVLLLDLRGDSNSESSFGNSASGVSLGPNVTGSLMNLTDAPSQQPSLPPRTQRPSHAPKDKPPKEPEVEDDTLSPSQRPSPKPTPSTAIPTTAPTLEPTPALATLGPTQAAATSEPTQAPIVVPNPTLAPTLQPIFVTLTPTMAPAVALTTEPTSAAPQGNPGGLLPRPPYPNGRFVPWSSLDSQSDVENLGYSESSWNQPDVDQGPDALSFEAIRGRGPDSVLIGMGVATSGSWNCWVNHYFFTNWDEMRRVPGPNDGVITKDTTSGETDFGLAIQAAYETLGWSSDSWTPDESTWPASEFKDWDELTSAERQAAEQACWTQNTWEKVSILDW